MSQTAHTFTGRHTQKVQVDYLLHMPHDSEESLYPLPLILFLHGLGERGNDLEKLKANGLPKKLEHTALPFIVVSPQCPEGSFWTLELPSLSALLDDVIERHKADPTRVYLTGLSMGGYGAWHLALKYPHRFAALAPICGGGIPPLGHKLKDMPIWAFHGSEDEVVPLSKSQEMVQAINEAGGNAELTVYQGVGHNSWEQAYDELKLYEWLLRHRLSD